MSMIEMAAKLFLSKSGGSGGLDIGMVSGALKNLLPGDSDNLDIGAIASQFGSGDLSSMLGSWLGDGDNDAISGSNMASALGSDKIASFASELGIDPGQASDGLAGMIPELINKNSSGGSLLDSVGGAGGLADLAKKLF